MTEILTKINEKTKKIEEINKQIEIEENSKIKNNFINEKIKFINQKFELLKLL